MLKLKNINKSFDGYQVLKHIDLEIKNKEFVILSGSSGSGKSTLLGIMSGILHPSSGIVSFGNINNIYDLTSTQLDKFRLDNCSFIFQSYNLFPALTALQNVEIVLRWGTNLAKSERFDRAAAILDELNMTSRMHYRPALLSGGEKQRVAIARAMVKSPKYLFADEPTSALDWHNGKHVVELLRKQTDKGTSIVLVTHDYRLNKYADRIVKMENGEIV